MVTCDASGAAVTAVCTTVWLNNRFYHLQDSRRCAACSKYEAIRFPIDTASTLLLIFSIARCQLLVRQLDRHSTQRHQTNLYLDRSRAYVSRVADKWRFPQYVTRRQTRIAKLITDIITIDCSAFTAYLIGIRFHCHD